MHWMFTDLTSSERIWTKEDFQTSKFTRYYQRLKEASDYVCGFRSDKNECYDKNNVNTFKLSV